MGAKATKRRKPGPPKLDKIRFSTRLRRATVDKLWKRAETLNKNINQMIEEWADTF